MDAGTLCEDQNHRETHTCECCSSSEKTQAHWHAAGSETKHRPAPASPLQKQAVFMHGAILTSESQH